MRGTGLSTPRPPSHGPSSLPCCRPPGQGTWFPVDMLWAERKGLMKGICGKHHTAAAAGCPQCGNCSSFREQNAQRGQAGVCCRPRLSQTWDRSLSKRRSLGRSPSPLHQPFRAYSMVVDAFCPKAFCSSFLKLPRGPPLSSPGMVSQLLSNLHLQVEPPSLIPALVSSPSSKFSLPSNSQASDMGEGNPPFLKQPEKDHNSSLCSISDSASNRGHSAGQQR